MPSPAVSPHPSATTHGPIGGRRARSLGTAAAFAVIAGTLAGTALDRLAARVAVSRANRRLSGRFGELGATVRVRPPGFPYLFHAATGRPATLDVCATASYSELRQLRRGCDTLGNTWDDPAYILMSLFGGYAGVFGDSCGPLLTPGPDVPRAPSHTPGPAPVTARSAGAAAAAPANAPTSRAGRTEIAYAGGDRLSIGTEIDLGGRPLSVRIIGTPLVRDGRLALLPEEIVLGSQRLPGGLMTPTNTAIFAEPVVLLPSFPRDAHLADAVATPEGLRLRFQQRAPARR